MAHKWARWLHHPCRLGGPHRVRAGGQNQNWPSSGQGGYITPAASGFPTASERGAESEVAHKWTRWLHHPCRLGVPHRFRAGGQNQKWPTSGQGGYITPAAWGVPTASKRGDRIRIGPQVGKVATSPLPPGGSHRFKAGGQNQKWPTSGQGGYITPAAWGVPTASERGDRIRSGPQVGKVATSPLPPGGSPPLQSGGTESGVAHKWARWLHHPCRLGGSHRFKAGGQNQNWPTSGQGGYITPAASRVPTPLERGERMRIGPQVGKVATSPLPPGGSPPLRSGGTKSELAHKWARWLHHPCRLGVPTASKRGDRIRSGPQVGKVATSPLPPRGFPPLQSGGTESELAHKWARWLHHPCRLAGPHPFRAGGKNENWPTSGEGGYITPAAWGVPTASQRGDKIRIGPQVGKVATSPLPPGGSHRFKAGGQNQKWPTSGQGGYITPAAWGVPTASERGDRIRSGPQVGKVATSPLPPGGSPPLQSGGTESGVAHKWARWLHHPCRLGGSHRFKAGGQNQNWPTSGQGGYITPAASRVPTPLERGDRIRIGPQVGKVATSPLPPGGSPPLGGRSGGTKSELAHKWARWLHHPCRLGGPQRVTAGGQNQNWPSSGQGGYITPAASGVPTASERGDRMRIGPQVGKVATSPLPPGGSPPHQSGGPESEVAHKWARWLHHSCRLGGPHRFRAGGQNQNWPTSGQGGYITPAAWGVPSASQPGDRIRIGPQVGKVATSPLPPRGSPPLQSGGTE